MLLSMVLLQVWCAILQNCLLTGVVMKRGMNNVGDA